MSIESSWFQNNFIKENFFKLPQIRKSVEVPLHGISEAIAERMIKEQLILDRAKKLFPDTNIIETLEKIRDGQVLISYEYSTQDLKGRLVSPALISESDESISFHFNCGYRNNIEGLFNKGLPSSSDTITISKKDNAFQLVYKDQDESGSFSVFSTRPSDIVNGIFEVVEAKKYYKKQGCL